MRKDKLPYGCLLHLAVCIFACLAVALAVLGLPAKLQVGQCVKFNNPYKESWEQVNHYIEIILERGKRNYRASFWIPEYGRRAGYWDSDTHSIQFNEESFYIIVPCPDKHKDTK